MDSFNKKFKINQLLIATVGAWRVSLRPEQPTVGSLVLSLGRKCTSFSDLTEKEAIDLGRAFKLIESKLNNTFQPQKINYLALMMLDEQVHYHVLPRYQGIVEVGLREMQDSCWPRIHDLKPLNISDSELKIIKALLDE